MELSYILNIIKVHWKNYVYLTCSAIIISLIVGFSIPKQYTSKVMLAPEINSEASKLGGLSGLASNFGINMQGNISDAIAPQFYPNVINSTSFMVSLFNIKLTTNDGKLSTTLYNYLQNHQKAPWWSKINPLGLFFKNKEKQSQTNNKINAFRLTKQQMEIVDKLKNIISCSVDKETNIITIKATVQDPLISAVLVDSVSNKLQAFITDYRTSKARKDLEHTQKLFEEARLQYIKSQKKYASYADANEGIILQSYKSQKDEMENDMQLRYNIYTQLVQQLQLAKAKVMERTPIYAVIEPSTVPIRQSAPHKILLVILYTLVFNFIYTAILLLKTFNNK